MHVRFRRRKVSLQCVPTWHKLSPHSRFEALTVAALGLNLTVAHTSEDDADDQTKSITCIPLWFNVRMNQSDNRKQDDATSQPDEQQQDEPSRTPQQNKQLLSLGVF